MVVRHDFHETALRLVDDRSREQQIGARQTFRLGHCNGETEGLSDVDSRRHDPGRADDGGDGHQNVLHVFQGHP